MARKATTLNLIDSLTAFIDSIPAGFDVSSVSSDSSGAYLCLHAKTADSVRKLFPKAEVSASSQPGKMNVAGRAEVNDGARRLTVWVESLEEVETVQVRVTGGYEKIDLYGVPVWDAEENRRVYSLQSYEERTVRVASDYMQALTHVCMVTPCN
jgi:hypothetical protein